MDVAVQDLKVTSEDSVAKTSVADLFLQWNTSYRLKLDDVVTGLRILTETTSMDAPQAFMKDVQNMVEHKVRSRIGAKSKASSTSILDKLSEASPRHGDNKKSRTGLLSSRGN